MAKKPPVHVSPRENGWAVVREGNSRATSVRRTQAEAAREGRDIARRHETGFLLHGKDGRIREHNDYGNGHRPQEGMPTGRVTGDFAPGTQALGEPSANEEGRTVQRTTDERGGIVETAFDAEGKVVDETLVGSVADLPEAEGYEETTDEEGITKRTVNDESGTLIGLRIGPDGSVLDLQIPPGTEKVEETTRQAGQAAQRAQDTDGQTANWTADRSRRAATEGARGGGILDRRTDGAGGMRGTTDKGREDDHFEMTGEGYADYEAYDQDGERLGKVDHLFLDEDDRLEYVGVETGLPGGGAVLIPAEVISAEEDRRRVVVPWPKSVLENGPTFGSEKEVTPGFEERVRGHYGLPSRTGIEGRSGHDAPLAEGLTEGEREGSGTTDAGTRMGDTETGASREHDREPEGLRQPGGDLEDGDELRLRRSEEELRVGTRVREAGSMNVRKRVRTDRERVEVPTRREEVTVERLPVEREASRTEIGGGEARMSVTEEEVVVEKQPVVKEEIRIRKDTIDDVETVEKDVRREEVEVDDRTERRKR